MYVGRPTIWGNPFRLNGKKVYGTGWSLTYPTADDARTAAVALYADIARGLWDPTNAQALNDDQYAEMYAEIKQWRHRIAHHPTEAIRYELRGKNLACWCPLDADCHADILLDIANR